MMETEFFTVPCRVCGEPMIFTSKDEELWGGEAYIK